MLGSCSVWTPCDWSKVHFLLKTKKCEVVAHGVVWCIPDSQIARNMRVSVVCRDLFIFIVCRPYELILTPHMPCPCAHLSKSFFRSRRLSQSLFSIIFLVGECICVFDWRCHYAWVHFWKRLTGKKNDLSSIRCRSDYIIENDTVNKYAKQSCCTFFKLHKKRCLL